MRALSCSYQRDLETAKLDMLSCNDCPEESEGREMVEVVRLALVYFAWSARAYVWAEG